jgi:hypothetical protein
MGVAAALLAFSAGGCGGDRDLRSDVVWSPPTTGMVTFLADMKVPGGADSIGGDKILAATLTAEDPGADLSFLSTLAGEAITPTATTPVATLDASPGHVRSVPLHVDYLGDLQPLFESPDTLRIAWTATLDPASIASWPPSGRQVRLDIVIGNR